MNPWQCLGTLKKCDKHSPKIRASVSASLVFLKIPACLYHSAMHSFLVLYTYYAKARGWFFCALFDLAKWVRTREKDTTTKKLTKGAAQRKKKEEKRYGFK